MSGIIIVVAEIKDAHTLCGMNWVVDLPDIHKLRTYGTCLYEWEIRHLMGLAKLAIEICEL